jgi:hypothetical protein
MNNHFSSLIKLLICFKNWGATGGQGNGCFWLLDVVANGNAWYNRCMFACFPVEFHVKAAIKYMILFFLMND